MGPLTSAGVCVALDHFLGLSSRWMRDKVYARDALDQRPIPVEEYLEVLRTFITDLSAIMTRKPGE